MELTEELPERGLALPRSAQDHEPLAGAPRGDLGTRQRATPPVVLALDGAAPGAAARLGERIGYWLGFGLLARRILQGLPLVLVGVGHRWRRYQSCAGVPIRHDAAPA